MLPRFSALLTAALAASLPGQEGDCNGNGILDRSDIEEHGLPDCNGNGLPDSCDVLPGLRFDTREFPDDWAGGLAAADLDGDGDADLATARFPGGLTLRMNSGDGASFESRAEASAGHLQEVAAADLNGDGLSDLAGAGQSGVELFLQSRGGMLERSAGVPLPGTPRRLEAGDLDGDGDADVAVALSVEDSTSDILSLVLSIGGTFQARNYALLKGASGLAVRDFDGDGDLDVAAASSSLPLLAFFRNPGNGDLPPEAHTRLPRSTEQMAAGDLDGDGDADLVLAAYYPHEIVIFGNMGAGAFEWSGETGLAELPRAVKVADLDGDGDGDVASATPGLITLHWSGGGGVLEIGRSVLVEAASLVSADFDDDGALDLASAGSDYFAVTLQRGGELLEPMRLGGPGSGGRLGEVIAADLDADGDEDLASTNGEWNSFAVSWNEGDGQFTRNSIHAASGSLEGIRASDLDGDGLLDLVFGERVGQVQAPVIRWNSGGGRFAESLRLDWSAYHAELADLDGDGGTDLVAVSPSSGRLSWIRYGGDRTFGAPADLATTSPSLLVRPVDLDGDRDTDLAAAGLRSIELLVNDGRGSFAERRRIDLEDAFVIFSSLEAADLDLDGDADLLSVLATSTWIHRNDGPSGFSGSRAARPRGPAYPIAVDLVGDPRPEIASLNRSTLFALFAVPGGSYESTGMVEALFLDEPALSLASADLDGDGISDLATAASFRGVVVFLNRSEPPSSADANGNGIPDECKDVPFHRGEADGNGILDISDAVFILRHLFAGATEPTCLDAADTNDDRGIDLTDAVAILLYLFVSGPPPAPPGPPPSPCGPDPEAGGHLGCPEYPAC